MNEEFYSIGRGSLSINRKFYYGLDFEITDFMRSLDQENQQLKQELQQKKDTINKIKEYCNFGVREWITDDGFVEKVLKDVLQILDNKGE